MGTEIERKFLLDGNVLINKFDQIEHAIVYQYYLSVDPEIRLREYICLYTGERSFQLGMKTNGGLCREEQEILISEKEFRFFRDMVKEIPIVKDYYQYQFGKLVFEVTHVDPGSKHSFWYCEVEFPTIEYANNFSPRDWMGKEVTEDQYYKMKNYWARTRKGYI